MLCAVLILERMPVGELLMGRSCEATLDGVPFAWMVIRGVIRPSGFSDRRLCVESDYYSTGFASHGFECIIVSLLSQRSAFSSICNGMQGALVNSAREHTEVPLSMSSKVRLGAPLLLPASHEKENALTDTLRLDVDFSNTSRRLLTQGFCH